MWKTLKDYAEELGVTTAALKNRIRRGTLKSKTDGKKLYAWVDDDQSTSADITSADIDKANEARARKWDAETDFKLQKVLNLRADLVLKKQKAREYRERLRTEFCEGVLECYTDAFSDLKGIVVDLKLRKEQIRKFRETYAKSLKKFEQRLKQYLRAKDDEDEQVDAEDDR